MAMDAVMLAKKFYPVNWDKERLHDMVDNQNLSFTKKDYEEIVGEKYEDFVKET